MSAGRLGLYVVLAAAIAVAFAAILVTDISSADRDEPEQGFDVDRHDPCQPVSGPAMDMMSSPDGPAHDGRQPSVVVIRPSQPSDDPMEMISDFERISAEKKGLEDDGRQVYIENIDVVSAVQPVYDAIKEVIGGDSFIDDTSDVNAVEVIEASDLTDAQADDSFLSDLADALEDTDPELSEAVRSILDMRLQRSISFLMQELLSGETTFSERRTSEDGDDDEADPEPEMVEEEENDMPAFLPVQDTVGMPYASCGAVSVVLLTEPAAGCSHGAADGPVL